MRLLLFLISLILTPIPSLADAELVTKHALKSCENSGGPRMLIESSLNSYKKVLDASLAKQISEKEREKWFSEIGEIIDKTLDRMYDSATASARSSSESAQLMIEVSQLAKRNAVVETINAMIGKEPSINAIQSNFLAACTKSVLELTDDYRSEQRARRDEFERRSGEVERRYEQRASNREEQERLRLIERGASVLIPAPAAESAKGQCFFDNEVISGFNKICYYSCARGTVTTNIRNTQICPLTH